MGQFVGAPPDVQNQCAVGLGLDIVLFTRLKQKECAFAQYHGSVA
jgi:hypothetical protein